MPSAAAATTGRASRTTKKAAETTAEPVAATPLETVAVVATLWCDAKLYAWDAWQSALLHQEDIPLASIHLLLLADDGSDAAWSKLQTFAQAHRQAFAQISLQRSHPIWPGSFHESPFRSGRIAALRQQVLDLYCRMDTAAPLLWWDADLAWDTRFLAEMTAAIAERSDGLFAAPYAARGTLLPAVFEEHGGALRHLSLARLRETSESYFVGGGGMGAARQLWERFAAQGGWRTYGRATTEEEPSAVWYGEEAHLSRALEKPFQILTSVEAWHQDADGLIVSLTDAGYVVRFSTLAPRGIACLATEPGQSTSTNRSKAPSLTEGVTIAVAATDLLARGITSFQKALQAQHLPTPLSSRPPVRVLIACEPSSRVALPFLREWAKQPGNEHVQVWEAASTHLYQELVERYVTLTPDRGLFFWGLEMEWDAEALAFLSGSPWPITTGIAPVFSGPEVGPTTVQEADHTPRPLALLSQKPVTWHPDIQGLLVQQSTVEAFVRRGGWGSAPPLENPASFLCRALDCPAWVENRVSGWRSSYHGVRGRIEWDAVRDRHYRLLEDSRGGEPLREY